MRKANKKDILSNIFYSTETILISHFLVSAAIYYFFCIRINLNLGKIVTILDNSTLTLSGIFIAFLNTSFALLFSVNNEKLSFLEKTGNIKALYKLNLGSTICFILSLLFHFVLKILKNFILYKYSLLIAHITLFTFLCGLIFMLEMTRFMMKIFLKK